MPKKIDEILAQVKEDLQKSKKEYSFDWLGRSLAYNNYPPRDIVPYLQSSTDETIRFISKIDKNHIKNSDFLSLSQEYERAKTNLVSLETFGEDIDNLTALRRYISTPILRDDFIIDSYQLLQSVVYGADSINLIAEILSKKELSELIEFSRRLGMEAIIEIQSKQDLTKAIFAGANIICLTKIELCQNIIPLIPNGKVIVLKESVKSIDTIKSLSKIGVDAFFISDFELLSSKSGIENATH